MMRVSLAALCVALSAAAQSWALPFSDTFNTGVSGSVWTKWTGANDNLLTGDGSHNHTPGGGQAARAHASDPAQWNGYADFGTTPVSSGASECNDARVRRHRIVWCAVTSSPRRGCLCEVGRIGLPQKIFVGGVSHSPLLGKLGGYESELGRRATSL